MKANHIKFFGGVMKKFFLVLIGVMIIGSVANASDINLWKQSTLNQILKRGVLRVGIGMGYLPFQMKGKSGKIIGFNADVAKIMAKSMGVKLKLVETAWRGMIPSLITGRFDIMIAGMTLTQKRNLKISFSNPTNIVGQTILIKKSLTGKIKNYKDLNSPKYTIATEIGTTGDFAVKKDMPKAHEETFNSQAPAALAILNGRVDALVFDKPYNAILYAGRGKGRLTFLDKPFTYEPLSWGIRHGDPDFLEWINNFIRQIKHDGTYKKLYAKWFLSNAWLKKIR